MNLKPIIAASVLTYTSLVSNASAGDHQELIDYFSAYQQARKQIVSESLAEQLRNDMPHGVSGLEADLLPLKRYLSESQWFRTLECYAFLSCRVHMLLSLRDDALGSFNPTKFEEKDWGTVMWYKGTQMNGVKGSGYVKFLVKSSGFAFGTMCWIEESRSLKGGSC